MFLRTAVLAGAAALLLNFHGAWAQGQGKGPGGPPGQAKKGKWKNGPPGHAKRDGNRGRGHHGHGAGIVRDYYGGRYWPCYRRMPPGIRKNLRRGKPLPPGLAKRCRLPHSLARRLPNYRPGYIYYGIGDTFYLVRPRVNIIVSFTAILN